MDRGGEQPRRHPSRVDATGVVAQTWRKVQRVALALLLVIATLLVGIAGGIVASSVGNLGKAGASTGTQVFNETFTGAQVISPESDLLSSAGTFAPCLTASTNLS